MGFLLPHFVSVDGYFNESTTRRNKR